LHHVRTLEHCCSILQRFVAFLNQFAAVLNNSQQAVITVAILLHESYIILASFLTCPCIILADFLHYFCINPPELQHFCIIPSLGRWNIKSMCSAESLDFWKVVSVPLWYMREVPLPIKVAGLRLPTFPEMFEMGSGTIFAIFTFETFVEILVSEARCLIPKIVICLVGCIKLMHFCIVAVAALYNSCNFSAASLPASFLRQSSVSPATFLRLRCMLPAAFLHHFRVIPRAFQHHSQGSLMYSCNIPASSQQNSYSFHVSFLSHYCTIPVSVLHHSCSIAAFFFKRSCIILVTLQQHFCNTPRTFLQHSASFLDNDAGMKGSSWFIQSTDAWGFHTRGCLPPSMPEAIFVTRITQIHVFNF